jgi:hypothetical protein
MVIAVEHGDSTNPSGVVSECYEMIGNLWGMCSGLRLGFVVEKWDFD